MIFIKLDSLETVNKLVKTCDKYKNKMDVDVIYGRYIVDGCSVLAVASLIGNVVRINANTDDDSLFFGFVADIKEISGWVQTN